MSKYLDDKVRRARIFMMAMKVDREQKPIIANLIARSRVSEMAFKISAASAGTRRVNRLLPAKLFNYAGTMTAKRRKKKCKGQIMALPAGVIAQLGLPPGIWR